MPPKRDMLIHKNKIKTQQNTNAKTQKRHDNEHTIETEDRNNEHPLAAKKSKATTHNQCRHETQKQQEQTRNRNQKRIPKPGK